MLDKTTFQRLYNESPVRQTIVTNDRWGKGILCKHGDFYTCTDRYNPGIKIQYSSFELISFESIFDSRHFTKTQMGKRNDY